MAKLRRIALTKSFADQALPSAGIGDNVLLVDQLRALGVPRGTAIATLLVSMVGFCAIGHDSARGAAFIPLIMASTVVTLGPISLDLGAFEATSTATLRFLAIPFAAAFAATMLLRILIL